MSFSSVAIKEANSHIQALSKRNLELEEKVKELSHVLRKQNEAHAENLAVLPLRMKQTMAQKDEQIQILRGTIEKLRKDATERENMLQHYKYKCKILDEITRHKDAFESVLLCLELVQEPQELEDNNNVHTTTGAVRETDLTNGYSESEDESSKDVPRPYRMDSGIDVEDNDIVAV